MSSQEETEAPSARNSKDAMFEPKPKPKMIRVLTVLAYVLSVSMAAILLSIYYIFMWDGRPHIGARSSHDIPFVEEENNNSYVGPKFLKRISDADDLSYNATNNFSYYSRFFNKTEYHVPSTDALKMVNRTSDDDEVVLNATIIQDVKPNATENASGPELQQEITAMESEEIIVSSTTPTTVEESVTWSDDYETLEELKKSNPLIKKIMDSKYYENY